MVKLVSYSQVTNSYLQHLMKTTTDFEFIKNIQSPEGLMSYCARVSSKDQQNADYAKLLKYCIKNGHWSVFEMADATFEITTSRAIAAQILRHRSFCFQEFSQRYAKVEANIEFTNARRQDKKNRQNSLDDLDEETKKWFNEAQFGVFEKASKLYQQALDKGIAKECARMLLPLNTTTKLYMKGNLRSWQHYVKVRSDASTQLEHREIAEAIKKELISVFPIISEACGWIGEDNEGK